MLAGRGWVVDRFGRYEAPVNPLERVGIAKNKRVAKKAGFRPSAFALD